MSDKIGVLEFVRTSDTRRAVEYEGKRVGIIVRCAANVGGSRHEWCLFINNYEIPCSAGSLNHTKQIARNFFIGR